MVKNKIKQIATANFDKNVARLIQKIVGSEHISLLDVGAANGQAHGAASTQPSIKTNSSWKSQC